MQSELILKNKIYICILGTPCTTGIFLLFKSPTRRLKDDINENLNKAELNISAITPGNTQTLTRTNTRQHIKQKHTPTFVTDTHHNNMTHTFTVTYNLLPFNQNISHTHTRMRNNKTQQ